MSVRLKKLFCILLPLLVCAACLAIAVGTYAVYGQHNLDSDISSEFILAQLLNEEGRFFLTDSWFYSTELRIVSPVPVYQLAMMLTDNWHVARTISIAVLLTGIVAAFVYMIRGAGVSVKSALLCAGVLILPITEYNSFTLVYGGFYTVCVMLTFVEIGLILRMRKKSFLKLILLAALGVYGGLNGVRMMMICHAPLLAACLITFYLEARSCESVKKFPSLPSFPLLVGCLVCTAGAAVGYWINSNVFALAYDFQQHSETLLNPLATQMFTDQITCLMSYFGYRNNVMLLSMEGIVSLLAVVFPIAGVASMILLLRLKLCARERMLAIFSLTALLLGMVVNVLTLTKDGSSSLPYTVSYYMPAALLLVNALFWIFDRFDCRHTFLRTLPMLALVAFFLAGNAVYRDRDFHTYDTELEDIAETLLDEAAYEGYATFWNGNVLTEITNGELEAYVVEEWVYGTPTEWLQRKDHMERTPWGRVFALYRAQDWREGEPGYDSEKLVYSSDSYYVVVYDSDEEFRAAIGW